MTRPAETAQTLSRGLEVLFLLAGIRDPMSPSQIATELGLSRPIVYRLVSSLAEFNLVRRNHAGQLSIGLGTLRLTENLHPSLREATRDVLQKLAEDASATAHFVVADGNDALAISVVEPRSTTFHVSYRVGSRTPLGLGAIGLALEAAQRGRGGIFTSESQLSPGAYGIVAPVLAMPGIAAAVGVVTLAGAQTPDTIDMVTRAAAELDAMFGTR